MSISPLARLAYASATSPELTRAELGVALEGWRQRNAARGVTGFLLYHRESVFQVLEGPREVVHRLYSAIAHDPRHHFVAKLIDEPIAERAFADWPLGLPRVAHSDLAALGPLRPFVDPAFCYWHCDARIAHALVDAFVDGPCRRAI
jgi:hypothetical protein